jgi:hypothetical protein
MASVLRSYSQIPARTKFLLTVGFVDDVITPETGPSNDGVVAFDTSSALVGTFFTDADISGATGYVPMNMATTPAISQNELYRDLGKQIVIKDANNNHLAYFRLVRLQNSVANEGVNMADSNIWMKVWSASGTGVAVVRTG